MQIPTTQLAGILFPKLGFLTNEMLLKYTIHPANLRHSARTNQLAARHFTGCFDAQQQLERNMLPTDSRVHMGRFWLAGIQD